ncbi:MAG: HIT domain-containing protein [Actinobacteria bacterium]|nr:HIT domain-containing protein [Actinomycetota bacterium]MSY38699.1 HIT domain-containing protein [Actinomycetota bacterium]
MSLVSDCLFCRIVAGEIPADVVLRTDEMVAFRDISPQAPVHVLVIPVEHHANVAELSAKAPQLTAKLLDAAAAVAAQEGLGDQFRLVFNTGAEVGQSVFHVHGHVLGGRDFTWPPG